MEKQITESNQNDQQMISRNIGEEIESLEEKNKELINFLYSRCLNFFNKETEINNFTISGGWGTGKTELINKLEKIIKLKEPDLNIKFIKINLWEFELFDENKLFIKIISNIIIQLKSKFDVNDKFKEKAFSFIKKVLNATDFTITVPFLKQFGINLGISKKNLKEQFKKEQDITTNISSLIKEFKDLVDSIDNAKIVIVFDDLDRVQENKILNILTAIKNFFFQTNGNSIFYLTALNEHYISLTLKRSDDEKESYTQKIFLEENKINITNKIDFDISITIYNLEQEIKALNDPEKESIFEIVKNSINLIANEFCNQSKEINFREIFTKLMFAYNTTFIDDINDLNKGEIFDCIFLGYLKRKYVLQWKQLQELLINRAYYFISNSFPELKLQQENPQHIDFALSELRALEKIKNMNSNWLNKIGRINFYLEPENKVYLIYYNDSFNTNTHISEFSLLDFAPFITKNNGLIAPTIKENYNYFNYDDIFLLLDSDFKVYIEAKIEYFFSIEKKGLNWNREIKLFDKILESDGTY